MAEIKKTQHKSVESYHKAKLIEKSNDLEYELECEMNHSLEQDHEISTLKDKIKKLEEKLDKAESYLENRDVKFCEKNGCGRYGDEGMDIICINGLYTCAECEDQIIKKFINGMDDSDDSSDDE